MADSGESSQLTWKLECVYTTELLPVDVGLDSGVCVALHRVPFLPPLTVGSSSSFVPYWCCSGRWILFKIVFSWIFGIGMVRRWYGFVDERVEAPRVPQCVVHWGGGGGRRVVCFRI